MDELQSAQQYIAELRSKMVAEPTDYMQRELDACMIAVTRIRPFPPRIVMAYTPSDARALLIQGEKG